MPVNGLGPFKISTPENTPITSPKMTLRDHTATINVMTTGRIEIILASKIYPLARLGYHRAPPRTSTQVCRTRSAPTPRNHPTPDPADAYIRICLFKRVFNKVWGENRIKPIKKGAPKSALANLKAGITSSMSTLNPGWLFLRSKLPLLTADYETQSRRWFSLPLRLCLPILRGTGFPFVS